MNNVIQIIDERKARERSAEEAWDRFIEAHKRSLETLKFEDGMAAVRARREFERLAEKL